MLNPASAMKSTKSLAEAPSVGVQSELMWQMTPAFLSMPSQYGESFLTLMIIEESLSILTVPRLPSSSVSISVDVRSSSAYPPLRSPTAPRSTQLSL